MMTNNTLTSVISASPSVFHGLFTNQLNWPWKVNPNSLYYILKGEHHKKPTSDIYSFAIIAYQIFTEKVPYYELGEDISSTELAHKILNGHRPQLTNDFIEIRLSFFEIYSKLSTDFSLVKDVNENEVKRYIEKLKDHEYCYHSTEDEDRDIYLSEASSYLKERSEKGDGFSSYLLGLLFQKAEKFERNLSKSFNYFKKSSEQGNSYGQQKLGSCYYYGYGVEQDDTKVIVYLTKLCKQGNSNALHSLGICYYNGRGVEQDHAKAFEYFKRAADLGNPYGLTPKK